MSRANKLGRWGLALAAVLTGVLPFAAPEACAEALADTAPERTEARLEAGRRSSWDARVGEMEETLRAMGIL